MHLYNETILLGHSHVAMYDGAIKLNPIKAVYLYDKG